MAIRAGARWVATNTDATLPSPRGPLPGNGSLVAAVSTALGGRRPDVVVGKPQPALFALAAGHAGARRALVVGDRLDTDIDGARRAGMDEPARAHRRHRGRRRAAGAGRTSGRPTSRPTARHCPQRMRTAGSRTWQRRAGGGRAVAGQPTRTGGWCSPRSEPTAPTTGRGTADADAVRALAAGAWAHPEWTGVTPVGAEAERVVSAAGLDRFGTWSVAAAS